MNRDYKGCVGGLLDAKWNISKIFRIAEKSKGITWDSITDGFLVLYKVGVEGENSPYSIIGGNQAVVLQVTPNDDKYSGQYAFGFNSNKIAFRKRILGEDGQYCWSEWQQV